MIVRPALPEDYDRLAPVASLLESSPVTGDVLRQRDVQHAGSFFRRWLADVDGEVVGYGYAFSRPGFEFGRFRVSTAVAEPYRGRGIGGELFGQVLASSVEEGATYLESSVRDTDATSQAVAARYGFTQTRHEFESSLDPVQFDEAPFVGVLNRLTAEGVRFVAYADTDRSEEVQRKLATINCVAGADVPGHEDALNWTFEQFRRDVFEAYWFRPEGQILAYEGDEVVGLGAVGELRPGVFYNMFTGVARSHRARGIATALKLLTTRAAIAMGATEIYANNASTNGPMLAINRKFGYIPRPGWLILRKDLA